MARLGRGQPFRYQAHNRAHLFVSTLTGVLSFAGVLVKKGIVLKSGAHTIAGLLVNAGRVIKAAALACVGPILKQANLLKAAGSTAHGAIATLRTIGTILLANLTSTAGIVRMSKLVKTGMITATGSLTQRSIAAIRSGVVVCHSALVNAVSISKSAAPIINGSIRKLAIPLAKTAGLLGTGLITRTKQIIKTGTLTGSASIVRFTQLVKSCVMIPSSLLTMVQSLAVVYSGVVSAVGDIVKQGRIIKLGRLTAAALIKLKPILGKIGTLLPAGVVSVRNVFAVRLGSLVVHGALQKFMTTFRNGVATISGAVSFAARLILRTLTGALLAFGVVSKLAFGVKSTNLLGIGTLARAITHSFAGVMTATGLAIKQAKKLATGIASFVGVDTFILTIGRVISASLLGVGVVSKIGFTVKTNAIIPIAGLLKTTGHIIRHRVTVVGQVTKTQMLRLKAQLLVFFDEWFA